MSYMAIKHLHMLVALISISGFILRGLWMLQGSPLLQKKLTKILPHINDAILLGSGIYLATQYAAIAGAPTAWLKMKVAALVVYIGLGIFALKIGKTQSQRRIAFILALLTFTFIVSVAHSHNPLPFLAQ